MKLKFKLCSLLAEIKSEQKSPILVYQDDGT